MYSTERNRKTQPQGQQHQIIWLISSILVIFFPNKTVHLLHTFTEENYLFLCSQNGFSAPLPQKKKITSGSWELHMNLLKRQQQLLIVYLLQHPSNFRQKDCFGNKNKIITFAQLSTESERRLEACCVKERHQWMSYYLHSCGAAYIHQT